MFGNMSTMDFDLEAFLSEVSQALRPGPPTAGKRPSVDSTTDDGESQDMDSSNESDENPMYSAAKRRRLEYTRRDSFQSVSSDEDVAGIQAQDDADGDDDGDMPAFFHPSTLFLFLVCAIRG
jgi:hypothetical protein